MDKIIMDSVHELDEIFPNRPPFMNNVEVIHPEIAKYAEMHISSRISVNQIPWGEIYNIIQNKASDDDLYKKVQNAIVRSNL